VSMRRNRLDKDDIAADGFLHSLDTISFARCNLDVGRRPFARRNLLLRRKKQ
jgi:hypothetical protein